MRIIAVYLVIKCKLLHNNAQIFHFFCLLFFICTIFSHCMHFIAVGYIPYILYIYFVGLKFQCKYLHFTCINTLLVRYGQLPARKKKAENIFRREPYSYLPSVTLSQRKSWKTPKRLGQQP